MLLKQLTRQPNAYMKVYYFTHSLVPISLLAVILFIFSPVLALLTLPYYLHIILDIPAHSGIWATRIFYPFSDWHFRGGYDWWKNKWFSIGNWSVLIIINLILILR